MASSIELISRPQGENQMAEKDSRFPSLSRDGRYVAFASKSELVAEDNNGRRDIYVYDRKEGVMELIPSGAPNRWNSGPCIGRKGRYVAYHSYPESVVKGKPPRISDIFVYNRLKGQNELITKNPDGMRHNGEALFPCVIGNKQFILFTSNGIDLVGEEKSAVRAVYLYDTRKRKMNLMSQSIDGRIANRPSGIPKMTHDGRILIYKSAATNLIEERPLSDLGHHLYLRDRRKRTQIQLDIPGRGFDSQKYMVGRFDPNHKASFIAIEARLRNVEKPSHGLHDTAIYIYDRKNDWMTQLSPPQFVGRMHSPALSGNGRYIAFVASPTDKEAKDGGLVVMDRRTQKWVWMAQGEVRDPVISEDGTIIAFESRDMPDVVGAISGIMNIYTVKNPLRD